MHIYRNKSFPLFHIITIKLIIIVLIAGVGYNKKNKIGKRSNCISQMYTIKSQQKKTLKNYQSMTPFMSDPKSSFVTRTPHK